MQWISVNDKLSKDGEEILIFNPHNDNDISIGYLRNNHFFDLIDFTLAPVYITHWMPLAESPIKDKNNET